VELLDPSANTSPGYENNNVLPRTWGAKLPLEKLVDPASEVRHRITGCRSCSTDNIGASPVSQGVRGIWYPNNAYSGNWNFECWGQPLEFAKDWTVVVSGSKTSHAEAMKPGFGPAGS